MQVESCKGCKRLFNYISGNLFCPDCKDRYEDKYKLVKEYIYEHPGCTIDEVSIVCDVSVREIKSWIKDGRFEYINTIEGENSSYKCNQCGVSIQFGTLCVKCKSNLINAINKSMQSEKIGTVASPVESETGSKMRYIKRD